MTTLAERDTYDRVLRYVNNVQTLETVGSTIARIAASHAAILQGRARRVEIAFGCGAAAGQTIIIAAQFYSFVPYQYAFTLTIAGVLLTLTSLALLVRPRWLGKSSSELEFLDVAAQARAKAISAKRMTMAAEHARQNRTWTPEVQMTLEWLLKGLENEIDGLARRAGHGMSAGRKHRRIVPKQTKVIVRTPDGRALTGAIADLSVSGVALAARLPRVALREEVTINGRAATVVRLWESGMALEFKQHLDAAAFDEDLIL